MWSKPVFFALYFLGAEVFAVKVGPTEPDPPKLEGGPGGSHDFGFGILETDVVVRDGHRPC